MNTEVVEEAVEFFAAFVDAFEVEAACVTVAVGAAALELFDGAAAPVAVFGRVNGCCCGCSVHCVGGFVVSGWCGGGKGVCTVSLEAS